MLISSRDFYFRFASFFFWESWNSLNFRFSLKFFIIFCQEYVRNERTVLYGNKQQGHYTVYMYL